MFLPEFENVAFEKIPKDAGRSGEKDQSNLRTNQFPVSFTTFWEKIPKLRMFSIDAG